MEVVILQFVVTVRSNMLRFVILFCAVLVLAQGQTQINRCIRSGGALPISANIVGCRSPPCQLAQQRDAVINVRFRAPRAMRNPRTLATAFMRTTAIPYDLGRNAVTCNFLNNARCPLNQGQTVDYTLRVYIERIFPVGTRVDVELRIVDDQNSPVMCLRVPIHITSPRMAEDNVAPTDDVVLTVDADA